MKIPIVSIIGKSHKLKTLLMEHLVSELKQRSYRVGAIKHDVHDRFQIDQPGKPTWRYSQAGADIVAISSPARFAMIKKTSSELTLDEIVNQYLAGVDIVLAEGFSHEDKPKIEIISDASGKLLCQPEKLLFVVSDTEVKPGIKCFAFNEIRAMADLLERRFLK